MSYLFFVDDTLICCKLKEEMILNLRCILLCFQALSRLNINLNKSEMVMLGRMGNGDWFPGVLGCNLFNCLLVFGFSFGGQI